MAKYTVNITEMEKYIIDGVEADSESEACDKAWELLTGDDSEKNKARYHDDSDGLSEAYEEDE